MGFHGRAAAHKYMITMCSAKRRLEWCKARRHWSSGSELSGVMNYGSLAVRRPNLGLADAS